MKKLLLVIGSLLAASPALAQVADTPAGQCASTKGGRIRMPPGCYAKAAQNAEETFASTKGSGQMLAPATVYEWMTQNPAPPSPFVVVDVRPAALYGTGHVPGATSIPLDEFFRHENLVRLPADGQTSIVLVCQSGHTASMALGGLVALGYQSVYVITGGTLAWKAAGLPVE